MSKVNQLLSNRFKKGAKKQNKMTELAARSSSGSLSSFSGVFRVTPLSEEEETRLSELLANYKNEKQEISADLQSLAAITSEVKAINNQAAILHGERIKQAQIILKSYRDGAFSSWLIATYGNRQTPYNFLQYFELYTSMPKTLQTKVDAMPRQALYTLATRNCPQQEKEKIIEDYKGETKKELLALIRDKFPLAGKDKRAPKRVEQTIQQLHEIQKQIQHPRFQPTTKQKKQLLEVLASIHKML